MEERLLTLKSPAYLNYAALLDLYRGYKNPKDKIRNLIAKKDVERVKRDLYLPGAKYQPRYSKEVLANLIYGPSAISLEYALAYHGLIPERVETVTSVCFKRKKVFDTPLGVFTYSYLPAQKYPVGIEWHQSPEGNFLMASKEKALCDMAYGRDLKSTDEALDYLRGLRIDQDSLVNLDFVELKNITQIYSKNSVSKLFQALQQLTKGV